MTWLPRDLRDDYQLRQRWIDNNMSYLDALALAFLQEKDSDYMKDTWPEYHTKHMCRLGQLGVCVCTVCRRWPWSGRLVREGEVRGREAPAGGSMGRGLSNACLGL
mmetsp:Transcript_26275/g.84853  ORF Transcript_26275/g.84853 Transcript_26275/m.84853 type:complete len:106 (-) Transcript_26275:2867-3184(-)|eukprot:scaffold13983_cov125-Isochrysis_galbana.AAC.11